MYTHQLDTARHCSWRHSYNHQESWHICAHKPNLKLTVAAVLCVNSLSRWLKTDSASQRVDPSGKLVTSLILCPLSCKAALMVLSRILYNAAVYLHVSASSSLLYNSQTLKTYNFLYINAFFNSISRQLFPLNWQTGRANLDTIRSALSSFLIY